MGFSPAIKYAVGIIDPQPHNGTAYLQESEYGLQFTFRTSQQHEIHHFDSKEEALAYMKEHFNYMWFEIVEVNII